MPPVRILDECFSTVPPGEGTHITQEKTAAKSGEAFFVACTESAQTRDDACDRVKGDR